ncbi:MAG: ImmA/IrrE family metallo-endopeptidase [Planctomyces sp.]|nr:ImmA/IrrE family metallo-endopeptidase [Planctomyces sp.]
MNYSTLLLENAMTPVLLDCSPETQQAVCDDIVESLLDDVDWRETAVDSIRLAARLGLEVAMDAAQTSRGRLKRLAGRPAVFLAPDPRPERLQWAVAHEIGEWAAARVFDRLDLDPADAPTGQREQIAVLLAGAILLPRRTFLADAQRLGGRVPALKSIYTTASHELILNGLLRLRLLTLVSVFDHGRLMRRRGNGQLEPPPLLSLEREAQSRAHESGRGVTLKGRGVRVQAWPVHEPGWKRELLRTTPLDEDAVQEAA